MTILRCLLAGCMWVVAAHAPGSQPTTARPPNVVLIVIDDLGWTDLSSYGSKFYRTPHVDGLAATGMRFTQAYAACPVCSPTRAALMTGKYPARLHLTDYIPGQRDPLKHKLLRPEFLQQLPLEETTIAELLKTTGYTSAAIGKWHLGGDGFEPTRQGFDVGIGGGAAGSVRSHFAPYQLRDAVALPGLASAPEGEYLADRLTAEAERFIEANAGHPFFLYLPHYGVHTPLMAKDDVVSRYRSAAKPPGLQNNPIYAAMVESIDQSVGRIVAKLDALGLADETIVIFTSDNGGLATAEGRNTPATNNAPLREGKGYLYEGGIRVPLIVKWPGKVEPSTTCATPVSSIDLFATIVDICHPAAPPGVDGLSVLPLLKQSGPLVRDALYWHYPHYSPQGGRPGGAIREGDFKLIEFYEQNRRELYNVASDISESNNLIDEQPQRAARMAGKLASWRKAVNAQMPTPNPRFEPDTQAADGAVILPARTAEIHGVMVRYEPLPHKNTLGFWVRADDWVSWDFRLNVPGEFQVEILQGCGPGSGGSQVEITVGDQTVTTKVEETGGFQDFIARVVGSVKLTKAGRYTLSVKPRTKPGPAVMDLRQVRLVPTAAGN